MNDCDEVVLLIQCEETGCGMRWDLDDYGGDQISLHAATLDHPHFQENAPREVTA